MLQCDFCNNWIHTSCAGLEEYSSKDKEAELQNRCVVYCCEVDMQNEVTLNPLYEVTS